MGIRTGVVSVGETPVANCEPQTLPRIASEDVESRHWHAFFAPARVGALDALDWTVLSFALLAVPAAIGAAAPGRPSMLGPGLVASVFGGPVGVADRSTRVRTLTRVIRRYPLSDIALPAGARKGAR